MRKIYCLKCCTFIVSFFLMIFFFNTRDVNAIEYDYKKGNVEHIHKETKVISFSYDYITYFNNEVYDGEMISPTQPFYSGRSITLNYDEYSHWWPFTDDYDKTSIYKYSESKKGFSSLIASFEDKKGSYTLDSENLYKIVYYFEDKEMFVTYVNICKEMHYSVVEGNSKYENTSAFSKFSFILTLRDAYDLRKNKYYYAFGNNISNLSFNQFAVFTDTENKAVTAINSIDRELFVNIKDSDSGKNKFLFIKIVNSDNTDFIIQTIDSFDLASKIEANIYLVDDSGEILNESQSFAQGDKINFKIMFNAPVTYEGLQYSIDGNTFFDIKNNSIECYEIDVQHVVDYYYDFVGNFKLQTKNNISAIVKHEGVNATLEVVPKAIFNIDVTMPIINILEEGNDSGSKEYAVAVSIEEINIKEVLYYASKCNMSQGNNCLDSFDDKNSGIVNLGGTINPTLKIDETFGKFNGENLALFVRAIDMAGNVSTIVKGGYVVDNVIVPDGEEVVFKLENVIVGEKISGKVLVVEVPSSYKVSKVTYKLGENDGETCVSDGSYYNGNLKFECLKVENYDFSSKVLIEIEDAFNNKEEFQTDFRFSMTKEGNVTIEGHNFSLYSDKDYEMEFKKYNYMRSDDSELILSKNAIELLKEELNFYNIPSMSGLNMSLVYFEGEIEHIIFNQINADLTIPKVLDLVEFLGDIDSLKFCAIEKCDVEVYLKFSYLINGIMQNRFVKFSFIDKSNKYSIANFEYENIVQAGDKFVEFNYNYLNNDSLSINENDINIYKNIVFEDKYGNETEVEKIDTSMLGKYKISEMFVYDSINSFPLKYIVEVVDSTAPIVRLNGKSKITLLIGENFIDPFAVASDNYDKHLIIQTSIDPKLDINKAGVYTIRYWCEDSSGNISEVITRTIIVKEKDSITTYLVAGAIGVTTILIMTFATIIEIKKEKKKR